MTRHTRDEGQWVSRTVDYDYMVHHDGEHGLLVVTGVPGQVCLASDEYWFEDTIRFEFALCSTSAVPSSARSAPSHGLRRTPPTLTHRPNRKVQGSGESVCCPARSSDSDRGNVILGHSTAVDHPHDRR